MIETLKTLQRAFRLDGRQPEPKAPSPNALNFPTAIFDGGLSKGWPRQRLTPVVPFLSLLIDTLREKHPDLDAAIKGHNATEQFRILCRAAGMDDIPPKAGVEALSLHLLIHLEHGDTLKTVRENFPDAYQRAVDAQGGDLNPLKFTVRLLEEFGIQDRNYPGCYEALKAQVCGVRPGVNLSHAPSYKFLML